MSQYETHDKIMRDGNTENVNTSDMNEEGETLVSLFLRQVESNKHKMKTQQLLPLSRTRVRMPNADRALIFRNAELFY